MIQSIPRIRQVYPTAPRLCVYPVYPSMCTFALTRPKMCGRAFRPLQASSSRRRSFTVPGCEAHLEPNGNKCRACTYRCLTHKPTTRPPSELHMIVENSGSKCWFASTTIGAFPFEAHAAHSFRFRAMLILPLAASPRFTSLFCHGRGARSGSIV